MILWFVDRFGLPGSYHRIWVTAISHATLNPTEFRVVSLHKELKRQLLMKLGSRKAPTWIPTEAEAITTRINRLIQQLKPRAVVLAAPESLAYLGLAPEHATLHNLRGSVYWRHGIPFIVTLPISAWNTLVSQKDIGAANYGFDSQEGFTAARSQDGQVSEETASGGFESPESGSGDTVETRADRDSESAGTGTAQDRGELGEVVGRSADSSAHSRNEPKFGSQGSDPHAGSAGSRVLSLRTAEDRARRTQAAALLSHAFGRSSRTGADGVGSEHASNCNAGSSDTGESGVAPSSPFESTGNPLDLRPRSLRGGNGSNSGVLAGQDSDGSVPDSSGDARYDSDSDRSITLDVGEYRSDRRYAEPGDEPGSGFGIAEGPADTDDVRDDSESEDSDEEGAGLSGGLDNDEEVDRFFYEPVLSPVGRFVILSDLMKLNRVLRDGQRSNGPVEPFVLRW